MVATGRGAHAGVLVRDAEALELLARIDTLLVDKTGTLTEGKPRVTEVVPVADASVEEVLALAAGLERASEHPLAAALLAAAAERGGATAPVDGFTALPGEGVVGVVAGLRAALGNLSLMRAGGVDVSTLAAETERLHGEGRTVSLLAAGGRLRGLIAVAD